MNREEAIAQWLAEYTETRDRIDEVFAGASLQKYLVSKGFLPFRLPCNCCVATGVSVSLEIRGTRLELSCKFHTNTLH